MKNQVKNTSQGHQLLYVCLLLIALVAVSPNSYCGTPKKIESHHSLNIEITGDGQPVMLLPALGCPADMWNTTIQKAFSNHQCFKVFIPGYAGAEPLAEPDFETVVQDLKTYIAQNNLSNIILIGHSFGGHLALRLAIASAQRVSKLIIVDSYPFAAGIFQPNVTLEQSKQQAVMVEHQFNALPDSIFAQQQTSIYSSMIADSEEAKAIVAHVLKSDRSTIARAYYESLSLDLRPHLNRIQAESLIIGSWAHAALMGKDKAFIQAVLANQYQNLANCEIVVAEKARHFIMLDEPIWFYEQLSKFIQ